MNLLNIKDPEGKISFKKMFVKLIYIIIDTTKLYNYCNMKFIFLLLWALIISKLIPHLICISLLPSFIATLPLQLGQGKGYTPFSISPLSLFLCSPQAQCPQA